MAGGAFAPQEPGRTERDRARAYRRHKLRRRREPAQFAEKGIIMDYVVGDARARRARRARCKPRYRRAAAAPRR